MSLISRLFSSRAHSVKQASALLAITALLSNVLGLVRNLIFYRLVPLGQLDVYFASFRIADFIFNLLILGAITSAFIPVVTELIANHQEEESDRLTNQLLSLATVFFLVLGIILSLLMPWITQGLFHFDPASLAETTTLSRLLLLQTVFFSWSFIIGGLLNGQRRFGTYAFAPLAYNVAIIVGGLLYPRFGLHGIVYSVIAGSFLHFAIQYHEALCIGFRFRFIPQISDNVRKVVTMMIPRSLSQGMGQLVLIVYANLASTMTSGSLAIFTGMNDLQTTPTVIIGNSLAAAFFPALAGYIAIKDWPEMNKLFLKVTRASLFLLIPSLVLLFILRAQIVRLYVASGHSITWEQTDLAIRTFEFFLIGIIPASLVAIMTRLFFALRDTKTPMIVSLISGTLAIGVAEIGIRVFHMDIATLAFAESMVSLCQFILYAGILHRRTSLSLSLTSLIRPLLVYLAGAVLLGTSSWAMLRLVNYIYNQTHTETTAQISGLLLQLIVAAVVGIGVYFSYSTVMSREELQWTIPKNFFRAKN